MPSHNHMAIVDHGLHYADAIIWANHHSGLHDLSLACALVEQESGGRMIFGCDEGPQGGHPPYCEDIVTEAKVKALLAHGVPNGVGLCQLTDFALVREANAHGGAWVAKYNCLVGFQLLHSLIQQLGKFDGIGAYNGGPGNPIASYAREVEAKEAVWKERLH